MYTALSETEKVSLMVLKILLQSTISGTWHISVGKMFHTDGLTTEKPWSPRIRVNVPSKLCACEHAHRS